jgi:hypothetical protein
MERARSKQSPATGTGVLAATGAAAVGAYLVVAAAVGLPGSYQASFADVTYREVAVLRKAIEVARVDASVPFLDPSRAGYLEMVVAQRVGFRTPEGGMRLARADTDLERGLSRAPADAYAWTRRATVLMHRRGSSSAAAKALSTALLIAPHDRKLAPIQFDLAVLLWRHMEADGREALQRRVRFIANTPGLQHQAQAFRSTALGKKLAPSSPAGMRP